MSPAFSPPRVLRTVLRCSLLPLLALAATLPLAAQTATGTIRGRVFNAATHQYVRNAEVRVEGTPLVALTEDGGDYQLTGVPAGPATVVVSYAGMQPAKAAVTIDAGQAVTRDLELSEAEGGEVVKMEKFEISETRSGQAAAVMERRAATNAKNVVASDNYGALTMGDVGEFMKSMPGLSLDYVEVDTSSVRIGGLDPKYSTFTTDGARMPTATSNNNTGRQNDFEQMSVTGIESIELNNTLTAAMDADAPGGSINLRSKYPFERKGREILFQLGGITTTPDDLRSEYFPDDHKHSHTTPSGQFGYGDVFLNGRLGIEFTASDNANFVEQDHEQIDWIFPTTGTFAGQAVPYRLMWRAGPKMTRREAANLSVAYKLSDRITLSLTGTYMDYAVEYDNQYTYLYFGSTSTSNLAAGSTPTHLVANTTTNTRVDTEYSHRFADSPVILFTPKLEYKGDTFKATLRGSYSNARYSFRDGMRGFFQRDDSVISNIGGFTADRSSSNSAQWNITQTGVTPTNDWSNPENWKSNGANNVRDADSDTTNEMYSGNLDLEKDLTVAGLPVKLLAGGSARTNSWNSDEGGYRAFTFVGPTGVQANAVIPYTQNYKFQINNFDVGNFNSLGWRADSNYATYQLYQQHPEYFLVNPAGNLQRLLANTKGLEEAIDAAYLEAQTRYKQVRFDLGLRYEGTQENVKVWDVRKAADVAAAGYTVVGSAAQVAADPVHYVAATTGSPAAGFASTPAGVLYQYGKQDLRRGTYGNMFLSGGAKYDITQNLVAQLAFSDAILRPDYGNLAGATTVNDSALTVTVPNSQLKPEEATKYYAGVQYYIEPSGNVGLSFYRLRVKDMQETGITVDPAAAGYNPNDYSGYTFISTINDPTVHYTNGLTAEYNQQLTFLPGGLKGLGLYGSVTRVMADSIHVGTPNKSANWGLKYSYGRFGINLNGTWNAASRVSALSNTPATVNGGVVYHAARVIWGLSSSYKLTSHFSLLVAGRNIFDSPDIQYSNIRSQVQGYSAYGPMWTTAIQGSF